MSRGRVEILACYDEIVYLLDSGNTYRYIHDFLYKNSKISISYLHFCSLLRRFKIRKRQDEVLKPIYDAQSELDKRIHKVKKIQKQIMHPRGAAPCAPCPAGAGRRWRPGGRGSTAAATSVDRKSVV